MIIDMAKLTLGQLADASEHLGASITEALQGAQREQAILTLLYVIEHDRDPEFTFDDARRTPFGDLEVVNADSEANARASGTEPPPSRASGG